MSTLTPEQLSELLEGHCRRVIDNMNSDDLYDYALRQMQQSFDQNPGVGDTEIDRLIEDIITAEDGDSDAASEFIVGAGIDGNVADELIANYNSDRMV
jgi:hypothetical protein